MCQGGVDPKYMMRDIEARMRDFPARTAAEAEAKADGPTLGGWITAMLLALRRGMARHV